MNKAIHFRQVRRLVLSWTVMFLPLMCSCRTSLPVPPRLTTDNSQDQIQTRIVDGCTSDQAFAAAGALLQDLGFTIDESDKKIGLIAGSKKRSAFDKEQAAKKVKMFFGQYVGLPLITGEVVEEDQIFRINVYIPPSRGTASRALVRVKIYRTVIFGSGHAEKTEPVVEAEMYAQFFDMLSKSIFLEKEGS